jgi:hypothetical protein
LGEAALADTWFAAAQDEPAGACTCLVSPSPQRPQLALTPDHVVGRVPHPTWSRPAHEPQHRPPPPDRERVPLGAAATTPAGVPDNIPMRSAGDVVARPLQAAQERFRRGGVPALGWALRLTAAATAAYVTALALFPACSPAVRTAC